MLNSKKIVLILIVGLIFFGILIRVASFNKDLSAEEVVFVKAADAISRIGIPVYYHSEQIPREVGLAHPPMYVYTLGFLFSIFETEVFIGRLLNIFISLLTSILIFLFCYNLLGKEKGLVIGLISLAIFVINYYALSSSILIDIDVFSMFFVLGFTYFILRNYQTKNKKNLIFAIIFMVLGLANRYPMMTLNYFFIGSYYYFNNKLRPNFKRYLYVGIISVFIFLFIWAFYSTVIYPGNLFKFIVHNVKYGGEQLSDIGVYIGSFVLNIAQIIRLFTIPFVILSLISIFHFIKKRSILSDIILLAILPILFLFIFVPRPAFGYPRYFLTIIPFLSILISSYIYGVIKKSNYSKKELYLGVLSFILSLILLAILNSQSSFYSSNGLIKSTNLPDFVYNTLGCVPLLIILFIKKNKKNLSILILIALLLSYSLYFDFKFLINDPSTKEVGLYLEEHTSEKEMVIAPLSIGYYSKRRYFANDFYKPPIDNISIDFIKKYIIKSAENRKMDDEFFWEGGVYGGTSFIADKPPSKEELNKAKYLVISYKLKNKTYEEKIGDFYIYKL